MTDDMTPYRSLDVAVLQRAVDDLRDYTLTPDPVRPTESLKERNERIEAFSSAAEWMFGEDDGFFSLPGICNRLGLNPEDVRDMALRSLPMGKVEQALSLL